MPERPATRRNVTQPPDWWDAFEVAAKKSKFRSVSEWLGAAGKARLPKSVRDKLSERPTRGPKAAPK